MLFPNRCPCCGKVITWEKLLCEVCKSSLLYLPEESWLSEFQLTGGGECAFDYAAAAFYYEGAARNGVLKMKKGHGKHFAQFGSEVIANKLENDCISADVITSVPMSRRKKALRGCNQAEYISHALSRIMDIPCDNKLLKRKHTRKAQHDLAAADRKALADSAYHATKKHQSIAGKNVILCDDIFTSGATMNKCAKLLKDEGAKNVFCVSLCRTENKHGKN